MIQDRRIEPGNRLPAERELAHFLQVSRPALRESLATLEAIRVIVRRPYSGIYLAQRDAPPSFESVVLRSNLGLPMDAGMVVNSMEVRNVLEVQAVDLACQRRTEADLAHLAVIMEQCHDYLRRGRSIIELDEAFHIGIVNATRNPVYAQIVHAFYRLSRPRREVYFSDPGRCRRSCREHDAILRAIVARDSPVARRLMHRHINGGLRRALLNARTGPPE
ncbi:MAG: FadR family transcriptional regulator [Betaproteobacteria bacterium]|nr:FadR family transcriptional regulator [Betaproteobacteria bacterium]